MNSGVYVITNTANGHRYVGSACDLNGRTRCHLCDLRHGRHGSHHLQHAWNKYGEAAFRFEVLEEGEPEFVISMEQWWMNMLRPEYNILPTAGSRLGKKASAETKARLSEAHKTRPPATDETRAKISAGNKGKKRPWTPEWRAKISAGMMGKTFNRGRKHTAETRAKNSAAKMGKVPWNKGEPQSPETRAKISASQKGVPHPHKGVPWSEARRNACTKSN